MPPLPATGGRDVHTVRFPVGRPPATADVLIVGAGPDARAVHGTAQVLIRSDRHVARRGSARPDGGARAVLGRPLGRARSGTAARALGPVPAQRAQ
ncbi:hypothetical protein ACIRRX_19365 [Streptomyces bacillaris]